MTRCPEPTAMAVTTDMTSPNMVRTSAVIPVRTRIRPTGFVVRSTACRQRPSNMMRHSSSRLTTSAYHRPLSALRTSSEARRPTAEARNSPLTRSGPRR